MPVLALIFILLMQPTQAQSQKLDASYEVGKDLILLQTKVKLWYYTKDLNPDDPRGYRPYKAIYWNPKDNSYYFAHGPNHTLYLTNGLRYKIDPIKQETNCTILETYFLSYAGSISPLERLYIDKEDGTQYIKRLIKINDPEPIYPLLPEIPTERDNSYHNYTNKAGRIFTRDIGFYTYTNGKLNIREYYHDSTDYYIESYTNNPSNFAPNDLPLTKAVEAIVSNGYVAVPH